MARRSDFIILGSVGLLAKAATLHSVSRSCPVLIVRSPCLPVLRCHLQGLNHGFFSTRERRLFEKQNCIRPVICRKPYPCCLVPDGLLNKWTSIRTTRG